MARMVFVRHGQTDWNIQGRWQGHSDIPLNDEGINQAEVVAEILRNEIIDHVYSSDLTRAVQTARSINQFHQKEIIQDPRLREQNLGRWEGIFHREISTIYPEEWERFLLDPENTQISGGESTGQLSDRIVSAITEIAKRHLDESVMIVAHGLALAVFFCFLEGIPIRDAYRKVPENAKPIFLEWNGEGPVTQSH